MVDDLGEAEQAAREPEQSGWTADAVRLVKGKPAVQKIDEIEERRSAPTRITAAVRGATSEEGPISKI